MRKVKQAQQILLDLGMPEAQQNEISAFTLLALCGIRKSSKWGSAVRQSLTITKGVMTFIKDIYGKDYAPNTRETFRRQVLHQFVQGRIADYNPDEPDLPTNSPRAHYAISEAALKVIKAFGSKRYKAELNNFKASHDSLVEIYQKNRKKQEVPVKLPNGKKVKLSPGKHNELQAAIVEIFAARFVSKPKLLYLGDTAKKNLIIDNASFVLLNVDISDHNKLPDVVLLDSDKKWLFFGGSSHFTRPNESKASI